jgi:hypothetical protein
MMRFKIPNGAVPGSTLHIKSASGVVIEFIVPENACVGEVLMIPLNKPVQGGDVVDKGLELVEQPTQPGHVGNIEMHNNPMTDPKRQEGNQMIKLRVKVPPFAFPGSIITVQRPNGSAVLCTVPDGANPGDTVKCFSFSSAFSTL